MFNYAHRNFVITGGLARGEHVTNVSSSRASAGFRVIGGWLSSPRKERKEKFTLGIAIPR